MRRVAAALLVALALTACGDDGDEDRGAAPEPTTTTAEPTSARELREVDLVPGLLQLRDFPRPEETQSILAGADFAGVSGGRRLTICGEDIRAELEATSGRFSQFRVRPYSVVHTVTALPEPEAAALVARFGEVAGACEQPWTQPDPNGGQVTRSVRGGFPLEDLGVEAVAYVIRARNALGRDDAVVIVARDGPFVSSLTVTGPVDDRFEIVRPLSLAMGRRLLGLEVG